MPVKAPTALTSRRNHLPRQDPLDDPLRSLHLAHAPRFGLGGGRVGHDAELLGELTEHDSFDLVRRKWTPTVSRPKAMLNASLFSSPPTVSGSPFQGWSDSPSSVGTTGSGMTKLGLNMALSTRTPAPPMVAVAPG
jgi:hypothetical protein